MNQQSQSTSRISETFRTVREQQRMAFMPFITAGDPDLQGTQQLLRELGRAGADLIEIGFPYSDPIADGPVIQASYTRALERKTTLKQIFDSLAEIAGDDLPPLVAMASYALIFRSGLDKFLSECRRAGISGLIIPDLPGAEAGDVYKQVREQGLDLIQLIAPTTPRERVKTILSRCSGFVYSVAVAGTTGERAAVATALLDQLNWLRLETDLPLTVGFGISKPEHVDSLRGLAEGVIVGSAIVRVLQKIADGELSQDDAIREAREFTEGMVAAVRSSKGE